CAAGCARPLSAAGSPVRRAGRRTRRRRGGPFPWSRSRTAPSPRSSSSTRRTTSLTPTTASPACARRPWRPTPAPAGIPSTSRPGDHIRITGRDAGGAVVNASLAVDPGTTLGNLIDAISAAFPRSTVGLGDDGVLDVRSRVPGPRGVLSLTLADATGTHGALTFPVMKEGALAVTLSGVTISGGRADVGAGLYNQRGTVTVVD